MELSADKRSIRFKPDEAEIIWLSLSKNRSGRAPGIQLSLPVKQAGAVLAAVDAAYLATIASGSIGDFNADMRGDFDPYAMLETSRAGDEQLYRVGSALFHLLLEYRTSSAGLAEAAMV